MVDKTFEPQMVWNKDKIKSLRLRLGWSQGDLARRLVCSSSDVELWENGRAVPNSTHANELVLVAKFADVCSEEMHSSPQAEIFCDKQALGQIDFSEIKEDIEQNN